MSVKESLVWQASPSIWSEIPKISKWGALALLLALSPLVVPWLMSEIPWPAAMVGPVFSISTSLAQHSPVISQALLILGALAAVPAIWTIYSLKVTQYRLTSERLKIQRGYFLRTIEEVELFRVMDFRLSVPLHERIVGQGDILVITADRSMPTVQLTGIRRPEEIRNTMRQLVFQRRGMNRGMIEALR